jgi:hypothetical protein
MLLVLMLVLGRRVFFKVERHLAPEGRISGPAFVLDCILVHADGGAPLEPACAALVAMGLVDDAHVLALRLAHVLTVATDGTLKGKMKILKFVLFAMKA